MKFKICGITNLHDAQYAVSCGAWALGFNFHNHSPRSISLDKARSIVDALKKPTKKIGIFVNTSLGTIINTMDSVGLDFAQVYGDFDAPSAEKKRIILAIHPKCENDILRYRNLDAYAHLLIDAPKVSGEPHGGTGRTANWELASRISKNYSVLLAGGLTPSNVNKAIEAVHPFAVDTASGVEKSPGIKNDKLIRLFSEECHNERK
jgi:phosphoribosylanthranilate isomerase